MPQMLSVELNFDILLYLRELVKVLRWLLEEPANLLLNLFFLLLELS